MDAYKDKEKYRERKEISMVFWWGGGGAIIFLNPVCSVLLCFSVRGRILESRVRSFISHKEHFFLSQISQI